MPPGGDAGTETWFDGRPRLPPHSWMRAEGLPLLQARGHPALCLDTVHLFAVVCH